MQLDFNINHLKTRQQPININSALIELVKQTQQAAGISNTQLARRMGFKNINKALRRFQHFEQCGVLPKNYSLKISQALAIDLKQIKALEARHSEQQSTDLNLFIQHFDQIWQHRKIIVRHRDYANILFPGLYLSVAYLAAPKYNIGLLLQHYMNGDWLVEDICCDRVYIIAAGGSPLSGNNNCHGFCMGCRHQLSFKLPAFGMILKAHKKLGVACEQRRTDKTLADLLREFPH